MFSSISKNQSNPEYSKQTNKGSPHPTTQSDPGSQTDRPQDCNNASGCYGAPSRHRSIGFAGRTADARSCKPTRPFLDGPSGEFAVP